MHKQSRRSSEPRGGRKLWNLLLVTGPARARQKRGGRCLSVYRRSCGENSNTMAARWPPNRCGANICASPAVRVEKMAEWTLFLHTNTRLSVVYSDALACLGVF